MPDIAIRQSQPIQSIIYKLRDLLTSYTKLDIKYNNTPTRTPLHGTSPNYLIEQFCIVLPRFVPSNKYNILCTNFAENYSTKIINFYIDTCIKLLPTTDYPNINTKNPYICKELFNKNTAYAITPSTETEKSLYIVHPKNPLKDIEFSDYHIITCNPPYKNNLSIYHTPVEYEDAEEPHMVVTKSIITFELPDITPNTHKKIKRV